VRGPTVDMSSRRHQARHRRKQLARWQAREHHRPPARLETAAPLFGTGTLTAAITFSEASTDALAGAGLLYATAVRDRRHRQDTVLASIG
jgi:hypothetical protein